MAGFHGDTLMEVEMEPPPPPPPLSPPALLDQRGISLPDTSYLTGSGLSLMGVEPPPGFTGTPMGAGEFSGSGQMPVVRQVPYPPLWTTATIASHTAPAVTMANYSGVSITTSLGRPIPLWA